MTENIPEISVLRTMDAAINRAAEGLRVLEDHQRMIAGNRFLTGELKRVRHDLSAVASDLDLGSRLISRDIESDVGRGQGLGSEYLRESTAGILAANFSRVQQALRTLEEFSKLASAEMGKSFEAIRFRTYSLQKAVMSDSSRHAALRTGNVYVLLDGGRSLEDFRELVLQLVSAGVKLIQFRDKQLSIRETIRYGQELSRLALGGEFVWLMNDRVDLALATGAGGVHVGQDDLPVADARRILGVGKLVGVSTHCIEQAREAVLSGADYIGVGPVFRSTTKTFSDFPGLGFVEQVANEISLPAFAIGGISDGNVAEVVSAGLARVAVRGSVVGSDDPVAAVASLQKRLQPLDEIPG